MSIHRTLHQEFRLPLFGVSFNPVEPVPQNVSVIRIEAPNGKAWIYRVSWDHPSNGQPDHYTLDISYTNHQGNRQDVLFNLGGNV
ncbi:MAG: hypothetical protein F4166_07470, partial [Gammaproteobacteria bacterium]|nr:hypothetical protein [Gammaproteobacteria bacterium]